MLTSPGELDFYGVKNHLETIDIGKYISIDSNFNGIEHEMWCHIMPRGHLNHTLRHTIFETYFGWLYDENDA